MPGLVLGTGDPRTVEKQSLPMRSLWTPGKHCIKAHKGHTVDHTKMEGYSVRVSSEGMTGESPPTSELGLTG